MKLASIPRRRYTVGRTPIELLPRLSRHLGGASIYVKRDDLLGLASGGNKTRKLEFLMADALAKGADTIITTGAVQSNHCRLTLAAAVKEGLRCRLLLEERVPDSYDPDGSGNNFLFRLLGAAQTEVVHAGTDLVARMEGDRRGGSLRRWNAVHRPGRRFERARRARVRGMRRRAPGPALRRVAGDRSRRLRERLGGNSGRARGRFPR